MCNRRNEYINNCLTCELYHIKKPELMETTNCVPLCIYSYYYTSYGQYKCINTSYCPEDVNYYIKDLKKCTDNCKKEKEYIYQYGGECIKTCPENTYPNENNICEDNDINSCFKNEREMNSEDISTTELIDLSVKNYVKEFNYTSNHVSFLYNNIYSIIIYKNINCIEKLSINVVKIDFGNCYTKVQQNLNPPSNNEIIIVLIEKLNKNKKLTTSYLFYHPDTGEKINNEIICKDVDIIMKESVISQLNSSNVDLDSA